MDSVDEVLMKVFYILQGQNFIDKILFTSACEYLQWEEESVQVS